MTLTGTLGATTINVNALAGFGAGTYTTIAAGVTGTTHNDTSVTNGTTYYYIVTAVSAGVESVASAQSASTPVALPSPWVGADIGSVGLLARPLMTAPPIPSAAPVRTYGERRMPFNMPTRR